MQSIRWVARVVVLGCVAGACGGNADQTALPADGSASAGAGNGGSGSGSAGNGSGGSSGSAGSSGGSSGSMTPLVPREPLKHRAVAEACDRERPPGSVSRSYGVAVPDDAETCVTEADCAVPESCAGCRAACVDTGERLACVLALATSCATDAHCTDGVNGRCEERRGTACTYDECFEDSECNTGGPCACEGGFWSDSNACLLGNCRTDADCGDGYCSPSFGDCGDYAGVIGYYCHTPEDTCIDDADCGGSDMGPGYCMYRPEVARWACGYGQCVG